MCSKVYMCSILTACLLIAVCRSQTTDQPIKYGYWDQYEVDIQVLEQVIHFAEETALSHSLVLSWNLTSVTEDATTEYDVATKKVYDTFLKRLSDLQIQANALGKPDCSEARKAEFDTAVDNLRASFVSCLRWIDTNATLSFTNISGFIKEASAEVRSIKETMKQNCPNKSETDEDLDCILAILFRIQTAKEVIPKKMLDESLRLALLMTTYEDSISQCSESNSGIIYAMGNGIVYTVERCIMITGAGHSLKSSWLIQVLWLLVIVKGLLSAVDK